ncbi:hypothetical protein [Paludibacterium yongneupense]|uniref:hypothetical protein n=1 Tax=Paludibacterium yongneupense TaxID=400061 RepID=UPI0012EBC929|nr:hypothetical protein [Paludibacterium yongneupense]
MINDSVNPSAGQDYCAAPASDELSLNVLIFAMQSDTPLPARQTLADINARTDRLRRSAFDGLSKALQEGNIERARQSLDALAGPGQRRRAASGQDAPQAPRPFGPLGTQIDTTA